MRRSVKIVGSMVLALTAGAAAAAFDARYNDARWLYRLAGRDRMVEACLPELRRGLESRGFTPADVEFEPRPRLSLGLDISAGLGADFSFEDGPAATRVDGTMTCVVGRDTVRVEFRTSAAPIRFG